MQRVSRYCASLVLIIFCFFPDAGDAWAQGTPSANTSQIISQAAALSHTGNDDGAATLCRDALQKSPNDPALYDCIGRALTNKGSYQEAAAAYEQEVPLLFKQPYAKVNLAGAYANLAALYLGLNPLHKPQHRTHTPLTVPPTSPHPT